MLGRLKEERQKANMSQIELSFAAGLSQNQVNCIEGGKKRDYRIDKKVYIIEEL